LAAVCIGLAAGSKYNGAFLCVPLVVAHLFRTRVDTEVHTSRLSQLGASVASLFSRWLLVAAFICALVFLLTTPYALLTPAEFTKDVLKMRTALSRKVVEGNHHYIGTTPYWYYVENLLFWAQGPVLEAVCLLGLFYALYKHRRQDIIIALWLLIYFYIVGGWLNKAVRYTLPMLPFLSLFGAVMFVEAHAYYARKMRPQLARLVAALAVFTLATAFLYSLAYMNIYAHPHACIQATRWAFANLPRGSTILLEGPTPHERPQLDAPQLIYPDPSFDFAAHQFHFVYLDVSHFTRKGGDEAKLRAELQQLLSNADYIFMTTRWSEGLIRSPEASDAIKDYYRALFDAGTDFAPVKQIQVYPRLFGLDLEDDSSELNFRLFDHPKVLIFKRKGKIESNG
jgi:hypothetical protein